MGFVHFAEHQAIVGFEMTDQFSGDGTGARAHFQDSFGLLLPQGLGRHGPGRLTGSWHDRANVVKASRQLAKKEKTFLENSQTWSSPDQGSCQSKLAPTSERGSPELTSRRMRVSRCTCDSSWLRATDSPRLQIHLVAEVGLTGGIFPTKYDFVTETYGRQSE
jgi:hypothetical protein